LITVNSLSGGKTSSYIAVHYPADYEVFALVRIEDKRCSPDKWLIKQVEDKIQTDFIATAESDRTLYLMLDLEQELGREIKWVTGETFDALIRRKKALPNMFWRFCTSELKVKPIFDWWFANFKDKIRTQIGYRYDEKERQNSFSTSFKTVIGKSKNGNRNKWADIEWREGYFPLINNKINHWDIIKFWKDKHFGVTYDSFPPDSNCVGCFWKQPQQLRKNWEDNPEKMHWFANKENEKQRWKKEGFYDDIANIGIQSDFVFGTGSGCKAGECTS
jgi:hypothetical protein